MLKRILLFIILNFSALAIGSLFTTEGVSSMWYQTLIKAPWTPPGWVFGAAWTCIMICFAFYMAYLTSSESKRKNIIFLFSVQFILNVLWNPLFFHLKSISIAMICISLLTIIVGLFFVRFWKDLKLKTLLIAPYLIWLMIASSLNLYILIQN